MADLMPQKSFETGTERGSPSTYRSGHSADQIRTVYELERPPPWQKLRRVPPQVREKNKHIYEPLVVSIGPIHHGERQFSQFEKFKDKYLDSELGGADQGKSDIFRSKLLERVDEIRRFYTKRSTKEYNDRALVEMMVRDACLVLYYMEVTARYRQMNDPFHQSVGQLRFSLMAKDNYRLENQIPWWVIKLLISVKYDDCENKVREFICKFFSFATFGDSVTLKTVPWEGESKREPRHLLEALRATRLKVVDHVSKGGSSESSLFERIKRLVATHLKVVVSTGGSSESSELDRIKRPFLSATELQAKGIYFKRSRTKFLNDIEFTTHCFYGELHLPLMVVNSGSLAFFSNIIALEFSRGITGTSEDFAVTSYFNFMKSLIENAKDVKMLQEKGIIISYLEDNEHIVRLFNEIDTHGIDDLYTFEKTRVRISEHCNNRGKTWIAELILTKFRTPWTTIAFFMAIFLLGLTLLQTYYTLNPRNTGN